MLFPDILMLLALSSFSTISSQRTEPNPSVICESIGGKKSLSFTSSYGQNQQQSKGLGKSGIKKRKVKVHSYCQKYIILVLRKLRAFYLMN